jgi:Cupin superfamily protein
MTARLLEIDADRFRAAFGRTSMPVKHGLADHDLLSLDALATLADALPAESVEHNVGRLPLVVAGGEVESVDASPGEIVRTIESNGSWMVLKNVEHDPLYRALLDVLLDEVEPLAAEAEGPMRLREAFIFLSAPGSITPSHVDPEHNFLLQVRGTKQMNVGAFDDVADEQRELERIYAGGHRNIECVPDSMETYDLQPGDGVYVRPDAPHFVVNGEAVSISFSITWRTRQTIRTSRVHRANGRLRRLRMRPKPPAGGLRDRAKEVVARFDALASRALRV